MVTADQPVYLLGFVCADIVPRGNDTDVPNLLRRMGIQGPKHFMHDFYDAIAARHETRSDESSVLVTMFIVFKAEIVGVAFPAFIIPMVLLDIFGNFRI